MVIYLIVYFCLSKTSNQRADYDLLCLKFRLQQKKDALPQNVRILTVWAFPTMVIIKSKYIQIEFRIIDPIVKIQFYTYVFSFVVVALCKIKYCWSCQANLQNLYETCEMTLCLKIYD